MREQGRGVVTQRGRLRQKQVERMRREKEIINRDGRGETRVEMDELKETARVRKRVRLEESEPHRQGEPEKENKMSCTEGDMWSKRDRHEDRLREESC